MKRNFWVVGFLLTMGVAAVGSPVMATPPASALAEVAVHSYAVSAVLKEGAQLRMSQYSPCLRLPSALDGLPFFRLPQSDDTLEFTVRNAGKVYVIPLDPLSEEEKSTLNRAGFRVEEGLSIDVRFARHEKNSDRSNETRPVFSSELPSSGKVQLKGLFALVARGGPDVPLDRINEHLERIGKSRVLRRFAASREQRRKIPTLPTYHFYPPESEMHDPNGLIYWKGLYHYFYQFRPATLHLSRCYWKGHAVSRDLVHWIDLPVFLYQNSYTGGALVEADCVTYMWGGGSGSIATSHDPLLMDWTFEPEPVIPRNIPGPDPEMGVFQDPYPFKTGDRYYTLFSTGPGGDKNAFAFDSFSFWHLFESDHVSGPWKHAGDFVDRHTAALYSRPGADGAVNSFNRIGRDRHLLVWASHRFSPQYYVGRFDETMKQFTPQSYARMCSPTGRLGWPASGEDRQEGTVNVIGKIKQTFMTPIFKGGCIHTQVRQFSLDASGHVCMCPVSAMEALRGKHQTCPPRKLPANEEIVLSELSGDTKELIVEISLQKAKALRVSVRRSPAREETTDMVYYSDTWATGDNQAFTAAGRPWGKYRSFFGVCGAFTLDTSHSSLVPKRISVPDMIDLEPWVVPGGRDAKTLRLHIYLDKAVVEVFVNDRKYTAACVLPSRDDSLGVSVTAFGGDAFLNVAEGWDMNPAPVQ